MYPCQYMKYVSSIWIYIKGRREREKLKKTTYGQIYQREVY